MQAPQLSPTRLTYQMTPAWLLITSKPSARFARVTELLNDGKHLFKGDIATAIPRLVAINRQRQLPRIFRQFGMRTAKLPPIAHRRFIRLATFYESTGDGRRCIG